MNEVLDVEGKILDRSGVMNRGTFEIYVGDSFLSIKLKKFQFENSIEYYGKSKITITPFSSAMFRFSGVPKQVSWTCMGDGIGRYEIGPQGHPADQDYDVWEVREFQVKGVYLRYGLELNLTIMTYPGRQDGFYADPDILFEEKNIDVSFLVPTNKLHIFLNISESNVHRYIKALKKLN